MKTIEANAVILAMPARKATPAGAVRMEGGQPVRRFVKELIRCGHYLKESDQLQFEVTPRTLRHWVLTCSRYLAAGNRIPVPATHTLDPEANRGWVVDVFAEGRSLYGVVDLVGEDGIKLAGTCDTSIYSPAEYVDGKGNRYVRPILHVALCTDPVIPGLSGFQPVETGGAPPPDVQPGRLCPRFPLRCRRSAGAQTQGVEYADRPDEPDARAGRGATSR